MGGGVDGERETERVSECRWWRRSREVETGRKEGGGAIERLCGECKQRATDASRGSSAASGGPLTDGEGGLAANGMTSAALGWLGYLALCLEHRD